MTKKILLAIGLALSLDSATAQTVLNVARVPAATPPADTLYVAGSFNEWNPRTRYALRRTADGTCQVSLPLGLGAVEYKFTRGSWATVYTKCRLPNRWVCLELLSKDVHKFNHSLPECQG